MVDIECRSHGMILNPYTNRSGFHAGDAKERRRCITRIKRPTARRIMPLHIYKTNLTYIKIVVFYL